MKNKFSIVILTYNEQECLGTCLESIQWCDDIVVVDSYSTDQTKAIALEYGVRVVENVFSDFAQQRNFANDAINFKYDWVFHLDADEHFTEALRKECNEKISQYKYGAYLVPAKEMLWGKWLKHSGNYPTYQMRFHRLGDAKFIQYGHGQRESDLKKGMGKLREPYHHFFMTKGLDRWFIKHLKYAAEEVENEAKLNIKNLKWSEFLLGSSIEKRRLLKVCSARLHFRPFLKLLYMYFFKLGFLDGWVGFRFCLMKAIYEQFIVLKKLESKI